MSTMSTTSCGDMQQGDSQTALSWSTDDRPQTTSALSLLPNPHSDVCHADQSPSDTSSLQQPQEPPLHIGSLWLWLQGSYALSHPVPCE